MSASAEPGSDPQGKVQIRKNFAAISFDPLGFYGAGTHLPVEESMGTRAGLSVDDADVGFRDIADHPYFLGFPWRI